MAGDLCLMAPSFADRLLHTKRTAVVLRKSWFNTHTVSFMLSFANVLLKQLNENRHLFVCTFPVSCLNLLLEANSIWSQIDRGAISQYIYNMQILHPPAISIHLSEFFTENLHCIHTNTQICFIVLIQLHKYVCS